MGHSNHRTSGATAASRPEYPRAKAGSGERAREFCRNQGGAVSIQHAVLVAGIVGAVLLGLESLDLLAQRTFVTTAQGLRGETSNVAAGRHLSSRSSDGPGGDPRPAVEAARFLSTSTRLWGLLVVCPLAAACWYWIHRRRGRKAAGGDDDLGVPDDPLEIDHDAIFKKRHEILRILSADVGILLDSRMHVRHLMSQRVTAIKPDATAQQVREQLHGEKIRHLMVCDQRGRLLGVISDRDLSKANAKTAKELMTANPLTVEPEALVSPAVTLLIGRRISCLPVVEGDRLVGVLTTTDLMMALQCALHTLQKVAAEIAAVHAGDRVRG